MKNVTVNRFWRSADELSIPFTFTFKQTRLYRSVIVEYLGPLCDISRLNHHNQISIFLILGGFQFLLLKLLAALNYDQKVLVINLSY
jgi:hypothetical protein